MHADLEPLYGPVLAPSYEVPIKFVFGQEVLYDRWDEYGQFPAAFVSWAQDLLDGFDALQALAERPAPQPEPKPARANRHPLRDDAEAMMFGPRNLSPSATLRELQEIPDPCGDLTTLNQLNIWKSRGRKHV